MVPMLLVVAIKRQSSNRRVVPLFFNPLSLNMQRQIESERAVFVLLSRRMFPNKSIGHNQVRSNRMFVLEEGMESSNLWRGCGMSMNLRVPFHCVRNDRHIHSKCDVCAMDIVPLASLVLCSTSKFCLLHGKASLIKRMLDSDSARCTTSLRSIVLVVVCRTLWHRDDA